MKKEKRLLVVEVTHLAAEIQELSYKKITKFLKKQYGCPVLLVDSSRQNTQGTKNEKPAYFIR